MSAQSARYPWRRVPKDGHTLSTPEFLTAKVNTLARVLKRSSTKAYVKTFDLTVTEWRLLSAIVEQQPCAAGELAFSLDSDKALTGRLLKKLDQRRLISIGSNPNDGRAMIVTTTTAGDAMYRRILPFAQARQATLLRLLSESEREQLWTTLDRLIEHVSDLLEPRDGMEDET
jgi:DNA-binding MarR family transcriptional regulator